MNKIERKNIELTVLLLLAISIGLVIFFNENGWTGYVLFESQDCVNLGNLPYSYGAYYVNEDTQLCRDVYYAYTTGNAVVINASYITLNCNGAKLIGQGSAYGTGIYVWGDSGRVNYVDIEDCDVSNYNRALKIVPYYGSMYNVTVFNSSFYDSYKGVEMVPNTGSLHNFDLVDVKVHDNSNQGAFIGLSAYVNILNSTFYNNPTEVFGDQITHFDMHWNNIYNSTLYHLYLTLTSNYNLTRNWWGRDPPNCSKFTGITCDADLDPWLKREYPYIVGTVNDIETDYELGEVLINGSPTLPSVIEGVARVNITTKDDKPFIEFDWNFSQERLNLSGVRINYSQDNNTVIIKGLDGLVAQGRTKTVYLKKLFRNAVCIIDQPTVVLSDFTGSCNGADEVLVNCPGTNGQYSCTIIGDKLKVSGLNHSGVQGKQLGCVNVTDDLYINSDTVLCNGTYQINDTGASGVIIINSSNVNLTCNGTVLVGNDTGYGIYSLNQENFTIKGCEIRNYFHGLMSVVAFQTLNNQKYINLTVSDNENGVIINSGPGDIHNNLTFDGLSIINSTGRGLYLMRTQNSFITESNIYNNNQSGIYLSSYSDNNTFENNNIYNNTQYDLDQDPTSSGNNFTNNWWGSDCPNSSQFDGINFSADITPWLDAAYPFGVPIYSCPAPAPPAPTPSPSGTVKRYENGLCQEIWLCYPWSECVDGIQTRVCEDDNECGTQKNKPATRRDCGIGEEEEPFEEPPQEEIPEEEKLEEQKEEEFPLPPAVKEIIEKARLSPFRVGIIAGLIILILIIILSFKFVPHSAMAKMWNRLMRLFKFKKK